MRPWISVAGLMLSGMAVAASAPAGWPLIAGDADGTRFSPLGDITAANVSELGLAWEFRDFLVRGRTHHGMEANPVLVGDTLFLSGPWGVAYALDARSGRLRWQFDPKPDGQYARNACCDVVSRGLAVAEGRVFVASLDGYLYALDAKDGHPLWKADTFVTRHWNYAITGAPHLAGRNILIGNAGADMGARGYVSAYDARSGKLAWRFWAVPGDPAAGPDESPEVTLARRTWPADSRWDLGLGGNAWDELAYDKASDTAYLGLGNGGPHPAWLRSRSGTRMDNLFLSSIVAVNATTGRMKWYYQTTPGDSWDYTATSPMIFADLMIDGRLRHVLMQAPKNGFFYVLDRHTGQLLRANAYTSVNWAHGVDLATGRPEFAPEADYSRMPRIVWPSATGGHAWAPMAFSPRTRLVYLPVFESEMRYSSEPLDHFVPGAINQAAVGQFPPFDSPADRAELAGQPPVRFEGRLKAWDPVTGRARWQSDPLPFVSGGTLVAGDLVFQGSTDGYLYAYEAQTGELRARLFTGTAMMAAPITYKLDGVQYVAMTAGAGGPQGSAFAPNVVASTRENYERLIVLKLHGSAIPQPPLRSESPLPPPPQPIDATPEVLAHGESLFKQMCQRCHLVGGAVGLYPNLWQMRQSTADLFEAIVGEGALRDAGMGNFSDTLTASDIAAIKAFVLDDINLKRRDGEQSGAVSHDAYH